MFKLGLETVLLICSVQGWIVENNKITDRNSNKIGELIEHEKMFEMKIDNAHLVQVLAGHKTWD